MNWTCHQRLPRARPSAERFVRTGEQREGLVVQHAYGQPSDSSRASLLWRVIPHLLGLPLGTGRYGSLISPPLAGVAALTTGLFRGGASYV
jgi:hypothetical protein